MPSIPSDLEISQAAEIQPIEQIAAKYGLEPGDMEPYGRTKAKVRLETLKRLGERPLGKYIDVTCVTPTPLGEGKTVTTIGLTQGLGFIGKRSMACIRQPSMGPTFGIKGGAAGGGYSQVVPMEDFNLHLTGDMHAVTIAHNLIAAAVDARLHHEGRASKKRASESETLDLDPCNILWNRVMDINDRALRNVVLGLGGAADGVPRESGFDISPASELMAILALTTGLADMRARIGRIVVGFSRGGRPVTVEDLGVAGAVAVLLKDAIMPNLMQTLEGQAAFVHAGPFANIAHGNSSIIADQMALRMADYVVTESGFGADIGMEKFFNIKCRYSGLRPDAVVLVCTVRSLKMHGGGPKVTPGKPLKSEYVEENLPLVEAGFANLGAHLRIAESFGVPVVVSINRFPTDSEAELALVKRLAEEAGAAKAVVGDYWSRGGAGAAELAEAVAAAAEKPNNFRFTYPLEMSLEEKIRSIAVNIYGADDVVFDAAAAKQIRKYEKMGYGELPVCMAKTQLSISHDPALKGAPSGFTVPIREVRLSAGAGFIYPLLGKMQTMPGLPSRPAFFDVDLDLETGKIKGLF